MRTVVIGVGAREFGLYAFVFQITGYLAIFQLGLDYASARQIAEDLGRGDGAAANHTFWELKRFNYFSVLFVIGAAFILGMIFARWGMDDLANCKLMLRIGALTGTAQVLQITARPYSAALDGSHGQSTVNLIAVARTISTSLLAFALYFSGWGVLCIPLADTATCAAQLLVLKFRAPKNCRWMTPIAPGRDRAAFKKIFSYGSMTAVGGLAWAVEATCDVAILGYFFGPALVTLYVLWWRFPQMLFDLCTRLATSAFPELAERHGVSNDDARQLFGKLAYITLGLGTLAFLGIGLWLNSFVINIWLHDSQYALKDSLDVAFLMGWLVCSRTFGNLLGMTYLSTGRATFCTAVCWAQALVKLAVAFALVRPYGIMGVVIASCAASMTQVIFMGAAMFRLGFVSVKLLGHTLLMTGLAALCALLLRSSVAQSSLSGFSLGVVLTTMAWSGVWLAVALTSTVRPKVISLLRLAL